MVPIRQSYFGDDIAFELTLDAEIHLIRNGWLPVLIQGLD
jgi:hypothetical protein